MCKTTQATNRPIDVGTTTNVDAPTKSKDSALTGLKPKATTPSPPTQKASEKHVSQPGPTTKVIGKGVSQLHPVEMEVTFPGEKGAIRLSINPNMSGATAIKFASNHNLDDGQMKRLLEAAKRGDKAITLGAVERAKVRRMDENQAKMGEVGSYARRTGQKLLGMKDVDPATVDVTEFGKRLAFSDADPPPMKAKVMNDVDGETDKFFAPEVNSGGANVHVQPWKDGKGFTLLVDVTHNKDWKAGEWVNLQIGIPTSQGLMPLGTDLIEWPDVPTPHGSDASMKSYMSDASPPLQPKGRRTLAAINVSYEELAKKKPEYKWLDSKFDVSVKPVYSNAVSKHFHETPDVYRPISGVKQGGRREFDVVPVNKTQLMGTRVAETFSDFLGSRPMLTTSMETEAEFVVGTTSEAEAQLESLILKIDDLKKDKDLLNKIMGEEGWSLGGPLGSKDVMNHDGTAKVPKNKWERYGIPSERKSLHNPERKFGRPGVLEDVYLHVSDNGVVRERRNHLGDGVMSVKGLHRRKEDDQDCMARYCRQFTCKKSPVKTNAQGVTTFDARATNMMYDDDIRFQDALQDPQASKRHTKWPELKPSFAVRSERYRYEFEYHGTKGPAVKVELSFDISTGQKLNAKGEREGEKVKFSGFEFGLDHLGGTTGGTSAPTNVPQDKGSSPPPESPKSEGKKEEPPKPVSDRPLDRQDLSHKSIMDPNGPNFPPFQRLVHQITNHLCHEKGKEIPLMRGGEKAKNMVAFLDSGKLPDTA